MRRHLASPLASSLASLVLSSFVVGSSSLVGCGPDATPQVESPVPRVSAKPIATTPPPPPKVARPWPDTDKKPVTELFHGTKVVEDYRWLEDAKDPAVKAWSDAQNAYARKVLDAAPDRAAIQARVKELLGSSSADWFDLHHVGKTLFALKDQPPKQQPYLVAITDLEKADKSERVILDPNVLDAKGATTIDWYVPSPDGKLVAVSLSVGGSESGTVHVYDVATGKEHEKDVVPRAHGGTAGGSLAWRKDGSGFWYTRYPHEGEKSKEDLDFFQQVWFHELGTDTKDDVYSTGKDFPRIAEIELHGSEDGKWLLARVSNGDGGEHAFFVLPVQPKAKAKAKPAPAKTKDGKDVLPEAKGGAGESAETKAWKEVAGYGDKIQSATFGNDGEIYFLSRRNAARGKITRSILADLMKPGLATAHVVVDEEAGVAQQIVVTKAHLYVSYVDGGPSHVKEFALKDFPKDKEVADAKKITLEKKKDMKAPEPAKGKEVPILPISAVSQMVALGGDDILFRNQSWTEAPAWYRYEAPGGKGGKDGKTVKTLLAQTSIASFADAEVVRAECTSKDGTKVPMSILRKKGSPDPDKPTMLVGYGGYGVVVAPRFDPLQRLWLDQGGVYAVANLRGGGEKGEDWHLAGNLTKKQNVFDDFAACAEQLVAEKYTKPGRLVIQGGSNGGLLMGAELVQHPEMFGAVVSHVGIYDMLRVELTPNGAFNVTEFGTVKDQLQFSAMRAYSPYHNVKDGTAYPPVLMLTGANDPRVDPYNSRKMVARLQAATSNDGPILLRTSDDTGHGIGSPLSAEIDVKTDVYAFVFAQLKHAFVPAKK